MGSKIKLPTGWELTTLSKVLVERTERKGKTDVGIYSVAVNKGVVNQVEHLGRSYAAEDTTNYNLVSFGDIVYTKSPTGDFPYGIVKQSHVKQDVAVSPLYGVYKPGNFYLGLFLDYYFQSHINANNYLKKIVNKGAKNTILVSNQGFLHNRILLPNDPLEQQKIAEILMMQDKVIALKEDLLEAKKKQKIWVMQNLLTGKIRLAGFKEKWKIKALSDIVSKCSSKNFDFKVSKVLTNSAQNGIVLQSEHFNKDIAVGSNIDGYYLVSNGDFVYNPRISVTAPCGPICRSHLLEDGVISPLYIVFRLNNNSLVNGDYLEQFFMSSIWFRYIKGVANYGARHDRISITDDAFFAMPVLIPELKEQKAIAECLSTADKEIELLTKELETQRKVKQYLMQQLLTGKIRV